MSFKVLFIATAFPPSAGPGAIRNAKFVKYLMEDHGVRSVVLTVESELEGRRRDESLLQHVPEKTEILRVRSYAFRVMAWMRARTPLVFSLLRRLVFIPDAYVTWAPAAIVAGLRVARRQQVDLIYTSSLPNSLALIGWALKRLLGIPWVADFRDPWTQNHLFAPATPLHRALHHWLEARVVANADRVIANTQGNRRRLLQKYPRLVPEKVAVIPNGYDPVDFLAGAALSAGQDGQAGANSAVFTIAHVGSFYDAGVPMSRPERFFAALKQRLLHQRHVDPGNTSSPRQILYAIRWLLDQHKEGLARDLRLVFVGSFPTGYESLVRELELSDIVSVPGQLPHGEAIRQMLQADALLLVLARSVEAEGWVPAKTYEYLYTQKPILGLVPEGEVRDLLVKTGLGVVVDPDDIPGIGRAVEAMLMDRLGASPNQEAISRFDRRYLTGRLKSVFDDAVRSFHNVPN